MRSFSTLLRKKRRVKMDVRVTELCVRYDHGHMSVTNNAKKNTY